MPRRIYFVDDGEPMTPEFWQQADAAPEVPSWLSLSGLAGDNVEPALRTMYVAFRPLWGGTADLRRLQGLVTATDLHLPTAVMTRSIRDTPLERPNYLVNWRVGEYWYWRHYTQRVLSCMGAASQLRTRHLLVHRDCMGGDFTCSPLFPQATLLLPKPYGCPSSEWRWRGSWWAGLVSQPTALLPCSGDASVPAMNIGASVLAC